MKKFIKIFYDKEISTCGASFYKNLQIITVEVCCRQKMFFQPLKFLKSPNNSGKYSCSLLTRPQWKTQVKNQAITVSHSKSVYQFDVFIEAYPFEKNQHYSSIQTYYIPNLIVRITFGNAQVCLITSI